MRSEHINSQERKLYGGRWADQAEQQMRMKNVMDDPALSGEIGLRALVGLGLEAAFRDSEAADKLYGRVCDYTEYVTAFGPA